jgi:amino acid transporter
VSARPRLRLLTLSAATFFIVSGGPYGLEEIVAAHGYTRTLALLLIVPLLWSLPVALMVGELGSAIPEEGGYYAWVKRGLGPFWGAQEAWLSLATSFFDMAIYPTLFVTYLGRIWPRLLDTAPLHAGWWVGVAMIAACTLFNLRGSRAVGIGSELLGVVLVAPFLALVVMAGYRVAHGGAVMPMLRAAAPADGSWATGVLLCMWTYMGWDNASPVAGEVEDPQRVYPRTMMLTLALVVACYFLPTFAAAASGLPPAEWTAGSWVEVGRRIGGSGLAWLLVVGGAISAFGMFNALVMSYSRLPLVMAEDGLLPRALAKRDPTRGTPTRAIVAAGVMYVSCLGLGLKRLVEIDVVLYGLALLLELVALVALRVREPDLARPFRIPGGTLGTVLVSVPPMALLAVAAWSGRKEAGALGLNAIQLSGAVALGGVVVYGLLGRRKT